MRVYSIHIRGQGPDLDRDYAVIKEGFSWPAFVFNFLWALWFRQWIAAVAMVFMLFGIAILAGFSGLTYPGELFLFFGWFIIVGVLANDMRRYCLDRAGFVEVDEVFGQTADEALHSYLTELSIKG